MTLEARDSAEGALTLTSVGGTHVETGDGPVIANGGGSSGFVSLVAQRVLSLASSDTCPEAVTVSSAGGVKVEAGQGGVSAQLLAPRRQHVWPRCAAAAPWAMGAHRFREFLIT